MGQYYKPYIRFEDNQTEETYCSQDAIYKTYHGITAKHDKYPNNLITTDGKGFYDLFSGLKLLEHSWMKNDFVNGVIERIYNHPATVAWSGDYADKPDNYDSVEGFTKDIYLKLWPKVEGDDCLKELAFPKMPIIHLSGFLVNTTKKEYIDLALHYKEGKDCNGWCIHPLPLLCAIGNDFGGSGSYSRQYVNSELVGYWAMDVIYYSNNHPGEEYVDITKDCLFTFKLKV